MGKTTYIESIPRLRLTNHLLQIRQIRHQEAPALATIPMRVVSRSTPVLYHMLLALREHDVLDERVHVDRAHALAVRAITLDGAPALGLAFLSLGCEHGW